MNQQQLETQNISFSGIGNVNRPTLENLFRNLTSKQISTILENPSFLYFLFFQHQEFTTQIISFLFQKTTKQNLKRIISELSNNKIKVTNKTDIELRNIFITLTGEKCSISNFFLQDIFDPDLIFKTRYQPLNFDLFSTSFYYLMNCRYSSQNFPLDVNDNVTNEFKFPFDIELKEWNRPIIIIDVQNILRTRISDNGNVVNQNNISIDNRNYDTTIFSQRRAAILDNKGYILEHLFQKHSEANTMVLFITQADSGRRRTCLRITNLKTAGTKDLLEGDTQRPLNRVALFIEVPCNIFSYDLTPERTNFNFYYDEFGSLMQYDRNNRTYYLSHNPPHNIIKWKEKNANIDPSDINPFLSHIKIDSDCSKNIRKNELDDYLIGMILLLSHKANNECFKLNLQYKPILFTNDNYNWMNTDLKNSFFQPFRQFRDSRADFFNYILDTNIFPIQNYVLNGKNNRFWNQFISNPPVLSPNFKRITHDICKQIEENCLTLL